MSCHLVSKAELNISWQSMAKAGGRLSSPLPPSFNRNALSSMFTPHYRDFPSQLIPE